MGIPVYKTLSNFKKMYYHIWYSHPISDAKHKRKLK